MEGNDAESFDRVLAELLEMGFALQDAIDAIKEVGPRLHHALDRLLASTSPSLADATQSAASPSTSAIRGEHCTEKGPLLHSRDSILEKQYPQLEPPSTAFSRSGVSEECEDLESNWEERADVLLRRHFGISSLKPFQKEALQAWAQRRDCLVLAATGSGKSLCFQIPALLTRKIVIVISPLISLMHDQCLKLSIHGISACFLGSGQTDTTVEHKAMSGLYSIVYVCPETVLRLIEPLQNLAQKPGIALFAVDEVHCISKWGHDFRPDYRRLSALRDNFKACPLISIKFDIPLMALTATATIDVREDIMKSLHMSNDTKIVLTSFFRPNLRFSVQHSKTSRVSSYEEDFRKLIDFYSTPRLGSTSSVTRGACESVLHKEEDLSYSTCSNMSDSDERSSSHEYSDFESNGFEEEAGSPHNPSMDDSNGKKLSVEYLEDEFDIHDNGDDMDVVCGEFEALPTSASESVSLQVAFGNNGSLDEGPTIIYVPTRKETVQLAAYLSHSGVRAAAYHAKLPKRHLRSVHEQFHQNNVEVVVATIAFGMGIDKPNVRRIIHYGWPQSLEAYYQEAGRAGRDGKLADCTLYADLTRIPTLLPSKRDEEQTKHATKMLRDCYRYGMDTSCCRSKTLVKYFGEDLIDDKCQLCDICVKGPPDPQNIKEEMQIFLQVLSSYTGSHGRSHSMHKRPAPSKFKKAGLLRKENLRMVIARITEEHGRLQQRDRLWWRALARMLQDSGYIREADDMVRVSIKYPELTAFGLNFISSETEPALYIYPEADMLLASRLRTHHARSSEWGRGWADPVIRQQRLGRKRKRKPRRYPRKHHHSGTVRGRIVAKLSKNKH